MSDKNEQADHKIEIITAVMLAVIIVAIAWCSYQSTLWGGIQTFKLRDVNSASLKFVMKNLQQGQYSLLDAMTFIEYINAVHYKNQELSDFYFERFRPEIKTAVQAWLETDPLKNPNAPATPFAMSEYNQTHYLEAQQFAKESELKLEEAQQANQNSDNYVLMTVIYASVLFIGGILGKMFSRQVRLILLITGLSITSVATVIVFFMPIATE